MSEEYGKKYFAFISYNHRDAKIARWLQRELESYRLPSEIHNDLNDSRYLRPVFRDRSDLDGGVLTNVLRDKLQSSRYLIVICSPNSASSQWVSNEVRTFIEWGRLSQIIPLVVDGCIGGDDECLPEYLREYTRENPDDELLAIDVREDGRHKALVRVVSYMLGLEFDSLWQRYQRAYRRRVVWTAMASVVISLLVYWFAVPVTVDVRFADIECALPQMRDARLSINDVAYDINGSDTVITCTLPGYWRCRLLPLSFEATYYIKTDVGLQLGMGMSNRIEMELRRDDSFAVFAGLVMDDDGNPLEGVEISIDDMFVCHTDVSGEFRVEIPLLQQSVTKSVVLGKPGYMTVVRDDEAPGEAIMYIMHKE